MLRIKDMNKRSMDVLTDDIERRIRRVEAVDTNDVSGFTMTYNEDTGKLTLTKGDTIVTFTKD